MIAPRTPVVESGINMTPMIDIVFQLILFFLFNLRFKSLDWRIESAMPRDRGWQVSSNVVDPIDALKATLTRLDPEDPAKARTRVKIGAHEWTLPPQASKDVATREAVLERVGKAILSLRPGPTAPGEIDAPPPRGGLVPHEDVVAVLDAFISAGILDVKFQGAAWPSPRRP